MGTSNKPLRVVQISDCHLFASEEGKLLGLNTQFSLNKVLELVRKQQSNIDLVLATGDLSQDGSRESYDRIKDALEGFGVPVYWLEGNHDVTGPLTEALGSTTQLSPCSTQAGDWKFVMLDSTIPGEVPGEFFDKDIAFLKQELEASKDVPHVAVCLHHQPVPMGSKWIDTQLVSNADEFWQVIEQYSNVRTVIWGHVHQEYAGERKGVKLFSVPSTCVQFEPKSEDFSVDDVPPGYRWFDFHDDGKIETGVERVEGIKFEVDFSVKGY